MNPKAIFHLACKISGRGEFRSSRDILPHPDEAAEGKSNSYINHDEILNKVSLFVFKELTFMLQHSALLSACFIHEQIRSV